MSHHFELKKLSKKNSQSSSTTYCIDQQHHIYPIHLEIEPTQEHDLRILTVAFPSETSSANINTTFSTKN